MRLAVNRLELALGAIAVSLLTGATSAVAAPSPPADLGVDGGQEAWRSTRAFRVFWRNPPTVPPLRAVHYRVRDPQGTTVVGPVRLGWPATDIDSIELPDRPGAYTAEVWLEDTDGEQGAAAAATLRFDDQRPARTTPLPSAEWIGRAAFPLSIRLSRPDGVPLSGIRGYAVSVSPSPNHLPCAAADRCLEAETDLRGGIENDRHVVADLPEGTSYLRAVAVSGSGMSSVVSDPVPLRVDKTDPTTALHGVPRGWTDRPVELTAIALDGGSGMADDAGGVQPFTAISVDGATPVTAPGPAVRTRIVAEGVHRVAYYARDLAGNLDDGGEANGVLNPPPRSALVRIDRAAPVLSFAEAQDPERPELIQVRVADRLSGADPSRGWIAMRRRASGDPFTTLPARPAPPGELRAHWDSEAFPEGDYEFRAVGFDRAGNSTATGLRSDGSRMTLSNPLKERVMLRVAVAGGKSVRRRRASATRQSVPFGRPVLLRGRLLGEAGALASQPVQIVERFDGGGATANRVTTVSTGADGSFSVRLSAGPSREVSAVFGGTETLTRATSAPLPLAVRGRVRMWTSARTAVVGGAPLLFKGRVSAAPGTIPPEGKAVELQFRLPGQRWTEFRTIRTDRRGRFRYRYRFSDDDSRGVRFLFRAYAPAQGDWSYEPAGSKPIAVRGL